MPLAEIAKSQWQPFFDRFSAALGAKSVDIDIVGPRLGSQEEARHIALTGLSYDRKSDIFAVIGEDLEHNILHPTRISADRDLDVVRSVEVVDEAGDHHILRLNDPLSLPPVPPPGA